MLLLLFIYSLVSLVSVSSVSSGVSLSANSSVSSGVSTPTVYTCNVDGCVCRNKCPAHCFCYLCQTNSSCTCVAACW